MDACSYCIPNPLWIYHLYYFSLSPWLRQMKVAVRSQKPFTCCVCVCLSIIALIATETTRLGLCQDGIYHLCKCVHMWLYHLFLLLCLCLYIFVFLFVLTFVFTFVYDGDDRVGLCQNGMYHLSLLLWLCLYLCFYFCFYLCLRLSLTEMTGLGCAKMVCTSFPCCQSTVVP